MRASEKTFKSPDTTQIQGFYLQAGYIYLRQLIADRLA